MSDPLSIAAGVAGIVALAGTVSKTFYQFFASIHDAPAMVRDLATALVTLNIALGQVQENLLNPRFVVDAGDEHVTSLHACLESCTGLLSEVQAKVEQSGLSADQVSLAKKSWESIKWSFNDEQIANCLPSVEAENTTLLLVVDVFAARLTANILGQIAEVKALVQKQDRRLKNIHMFCQWIVGRETMGCGSPHSDKQRVHTSSFAASAAYSEEDIARLLDDSGSVLSLTLGDAVEDSIGAIWAPDPVSRLPLRRTISKMMLGNPRTDRRGHYMHVGKVVALSTPGPIGSSDVLSAISSLTSATSSLFKRPPSSAMLQYYFRVSARVALNAVALHGSMSPVLFGGLFEKAASVDENMTADLESFQTLYPAVEKYAGGQVTDELLTSHFERMRGAISAYILFAGNILNPEPGKSKTIQALRAIAKAESNETKRKRLCSAVFREYEALKQVHAFKMASQAAEMQKKQLDMQQQLAADVRALLEKSAPTLQVEANNDRHIPATAEVSVEHKEVIVSAGVVDGK
ncbi:hypothetical protein MMC30_009414 [Trapelia coarctata]|nr:hypothetical protein [Trapelia coarctata]